MKKNNVLPRWHLVDEKMSEALVLEQQPNFPMMGDVPIVITFDEGEYENLYIHMFGIQRIEGYDQVVFSASILRAPEMLYNKTIMDDEQLQHYLRMIAEELAPEQE